MKHIPLVARTLICMIFAGTAYAEIMVARCGEIKGPQTYYITENYGRKSSYKLNHFEDHETRISNTEMIVIWNENQGRARMALSNGTGELSWDEMLLIDDDRNQKTFQFSFVGMSKGAPIMISIYPNEKVATFSQHSLWRPPVADGVRTFMFHSKCDIDWRSS